jgi:hypothetical protein
MPTSYLRANFQIRAGQYQIAPGALTSFVAAVSVAGVTDAGGLLTISMGGAGAPSMWLAANIMSIPTQSVFAAGAAWIVVPTQSFSGSIGWLALYGSGILATAATYRALATALIGSVF